MFRLEAKRRVLKSIEMLNPSVKARIKEVLLRITKRPCLIRGLIFRLVNEKECRLFLRDLRNIINSPVGIITLGLLFLRG
jgi:hypothetical protein